MPHKNGNCQKCGRKLKHKEWLPKITRRRRFGRLDPYHLTQARTLKCPGCDYETKGWKTRQVEVYDKWKAKQ